MKIKFQTKEIHYTSEGTGETLVLLHGFLESKEIWTEFIPEFSKYGRVITIDLPGHGVSEVIDEIHSMELMAESVKTVLDHLKIEKSNFIGHSMGGYVTLAFMERYPEMSGEIMLLNSTPQEDDEEKKTIRERSVALAEKNKKAYVSMAISNLLPPENQKKYQKEVNVLKERAYNFSVKGITAALKGMKIRTNKFETLKNYKGVKAIVAGELDPIMNYHDIKKLANRSNCRFYGVPGGHLTYMEARQDFINLCISSKK
ncbi:alpha/beta fold hydrolase [Salinimicrobium flavum]|uniref:Alpha/beta fold hydrolase n=1 Tax=Salinimicrobium flavum TaxID=1737065 RepID=A0ABW5IU06_9FLAO